jgi:hypothetical protein
VLSRDGSGEQARLRQRLQDENPRRFSCSPATAPASKLACANTIV